MTLPEDDIPLEPPAGPDGALSATTEPEREPSDADQRPPVESGIPERKGMSVRSALTAGMLGLVYVSLFLSGGEAAVFALSGLEVVPFLVLAVLAYAATDRRWLKGLALGYWVVLVGGIGAFCFLFGFIGVVDPEMQSMVSKSDPSDVPIPEPTLEQLIRIGFVAISVFVSFIIGLACFLPTVRRGFARVINIDAQSFVHATAVATAVGASLLLITPLLFSSQPPLLALVTAEGAADMPDGGEQLRSSVYILIWTVPASLIAVGFPRKRTLNEALCRLGLVLPSRRNLVCAIIAAVLLVFIAQALDTWSTRLWLAMGWQTTDQEAVWKLFSFALGPVGAVIVAITAGLGEELVFRGVLQSRIGILLSSFLFTSVHAFQYNFDGLVQVLLLGFIFGLIRKLSNTSTSALVHGGYDLIAFLGM